MEFTKAELEHASKLNELVMRQVKMGVPEGLALSVVAISLGQVAHKLKVPREQLPRLVPLLETAWDGCEAGAEQARKEHGK